VADLVSIAAILHNDPTALINTNKKKGTLYKQQNVFGKSDNTTEGLYKRLYISCDVIELLIAFYAIQKKFSEIKNNPDSVMSLLKWFEENGLMFGAWAKMIETRDSIIQTLIASVGLNPMYNGLGLRKFTYDLPSLCQQHFDIGIAEISKLKQCMYMGYRLQTASWDDDKSVYVHDANGMPIVMMSKLVAPLPIHTQFKQSRPQKIIAFSPVLKLPPRSEDGRYGLFVSTISSLDGHVNYDETFDIS
jgi:hypothetical protein